MEGEGNVAAGLDNLSNLYLNAGKADFAAPLCTESLEIYRALGEKWRLCMAELTMATITQSCQQYPVATTHYQEALRLAEDLGLLGLQATIFAGWSQLAQACDDLPAATAYHQKHLELTRQMG